jgi:tetratricopeptide (TPR) repeat protein
MIVSKCLVLVAVLLLAERTTSATGTAAGTADREREARTACLAGDYAKGVAVLSELFVATEDPIFIYNQGRCFEQNRRYEDAIARFQEFLLVGQKSSKSSKAEAQKHITTCTNLLAKQGASDGNAGPGDSKEAKERAAKKACLNGETAKGVALLTDLYVDTNDPTYIFNQGRCYEQTNRCEEAIVRFREYLRKTPNGTERDHADLAKHIADCEALIAKSGSGSTALPMATNPPAPKGARPEPLPDAAGVATPAEKAEESGQDIRRPGVGLRVAGVITMSAGTALVLAGGALNLKHNAMVHDIQGDYSVSTADSAQTYKTLSTVGYGAGAACLLGGAVLYWMGHRAGHVVIAPSPVAGRAGLLLAGGF